MSDKQWVHLGIVILIVLCLYLIYKVINTQPLPDYIPDQSEYHYVKLIQYIKNS